VSTWAECNWSVLWPLSHKGKGFVLLDKREYADCGLTCLAEPGTKKIPVRWSGDTPKLEQTVRVAGILSQSEKGLSFVAQEIGIP
jgi:hypothetical protein